MSNTILDNIIHQNLVKFNMTYDRVCNKINTTGVTSGARTAYPSGAPEFTPVFREFVLLDL